MPSPRGGILLRADRGAFRALPACAARAAAAWLCAMAKLYFNYSTMNAGKSTVLLQASHNYRENGMETYLLTAAIDGRARRVRRADRQAGQGESAGRTTPGVVSRRRRLADTAAGATTPNASRSGPAHRRRRTRIVLPIRRSADQLRTLVSTFGTLTVGTS